MRAFWWFRENDIAGMGRPGFNGTHWYDLSFEEASLLGWLGLFDSGSASLESYRNHVNEYVPKILEYYKFGDEEARLLLKELRKVSGLRSLLDKLSQRTRILEDYKIGEDHLHFQFSRNHLDREIEFLKQKGISRIICLTEKHHNRQALSEHFDLHHFPIPDLGAPQIDQVQEVANIISLSRKNGERVVVHCLAGVGRTSTVIMGAHRILGESLESLKIQIAEKNPLFSLSGSQEEFLRSL